MALGKAVVAGAAAAVALPLIAEESGPLGGLLRRGLVHFSLGGYHLAWSWTLFCVVTLVAWGLLAWADR